MNPPFTVEQFFNVFARYNHALWWAAAGLWIGATLTVNAAWNDRSGRSRRLTWFLAVLWLWNALAYHVAFFTAINPAAWIFAAAFTLQALLFVYAASRGGFAYFTAGGWRRRAGAALIVYALAYPVLNLTFGHEYPGTPTFGVPCPTAILTLGLLLTARAGSARWLSVIPALWGFVAAWAALLFNVWPDYVLVLAAVVIVSDMVGRLTPRALHQPEPGVRSGHAHRVQAAKTLRGDPMTPELATFIDRRDVPFSPGQRAQAAQNPGLLAYLKNSSPSSLVVVPAVYSVVLPFAALDLFTTIFQWVFFPLLRIPRVRRRDYLVIDRHRLGYLNAIEKVHCLYCSYANGLIAYVREIAARTEQYACPIKHGRPIAAPHDRYRLFVNYGDAEGYRKELEELRRSLRHPTAERAVSSS